MNKYLIIKNWGSVIVNTLFLLFIPYCLVFTGCLSPPDTDTAFTDIKAEKLVFPDIQFDESPPSDYLSEGAFKYVIPKFMEVGNTKEFQFEIALENVFTSDKPHTGNQPVDSIGTLSVADVMSVKLVDSSGSSIIKTESREEQSILPKRDSSSTIWIWQVTPQKKGHHKFSFYVTRKEGKSYHNFHVRNINVIVNVKKPEPPDTVEVARVKVVDTLKISPPEKKSNRKGFLWLVSIPILGLLIWFASRKRQQQKQQLIPLMEFNAFKSNFHELIARDNIEKAFSTLEHLLKKYKDSKLEHELVLLKSNYQNNISRNNNNLIGNDEFNLNRSKVVNELIAMIDRLEKEAS